MKIDVGAHIADLLYEHDTVIIPGLGGFVTQYQPASVDQVQGKMHPPSKSLSFNDHLVVNDGLLINLIKEKHSLSYAEAERLVDEYVQGVKEAVERREIVEFPRVGRLYKDYEQKLQFLPESTNFNLDSFGLPAVQFYPVAQTTRRGPGAADAAAGASVEQKTAPAAWFRQNGSLLAVVAACLVVFAIVVTFLLLRGRWDAQGEEEVARDIPSSRINTKPSLENDTAGEAEPPNLSGAEEEVEQPAEDDTEESTPPPGSKTAYIAIGMFGDEGNVNKLVKELFAAGYEPFTEPVRNMTRVGVRMQYQRNTEVETTLEDIRNRFDHEAFVLRRGGG